MTSRNHWRGWQTLSACALLAFVSLTWTARFLLGQPSQGAPKPIGSSFENQIKPFLQQNCVRCHNAELSTSGVRVDHLDAAFEDGRMPLWERIRRKIGDGSMPPKGQPQPAATERQRVAEWITQALDLARSRPAPKNGLVRRLTVAQYRNTLRELLLLDDDLTDALPPDAVSKDGFVNNQETLQLSPLLMEAYFEIAAEALNRAIVDPHSRPAIQNFRVDLGASVNPHPFPDPLILGANSLLLDNKDFLVTQLTPAKPFPFEPRFMRTKYRFIEGYAGNATVRGWREYDSIYHAVFACIRGNRGYPKGSAYSTVPQGLLLRPAIPSDEILASTEPMGQRRISRSRSANCRITAGFELPSLAAKYNDGLLLDPGAPAQADASAAVIIREGLKNRQQIVIPKPGIYQIDVYDSAPSKAAVIPDSARLGEGLALSWPLAANSSRRFEGSARLVDSPFGKAVSLQADGDSVVIPDHEMSERWRRGFHGGGLDTTRDSFEKRASSVSECLRRRTGGTSRCPTTGVLRIETAGPENLYGFFPAGSDSRRDLAARSGRCAEGSRIKRGCT